jgi:hypothetical protein
MTGAASEARLRARDRVAVITTPVAAGSASAASRIGQAIPTRPERRGAIAADRGLTSGSGRRCATRFGAGAVSRAARCARAAPWCAVGYKC